MGGYIRFGYTKGENNQLVIDEDAAKIVLSMFENTAEGNRIKDWVDWANNEGIPTPKGGRAWTHNQVSKFLRDRTFIGQGSVGKYVRRNGKVVKSDSPIPVPYPQIVPAKLFNKVQERLILNKKRNKGSAKRLYVLSHLGKCGVCGATLYCYSSKGYNYLSCMRQRFYSSLYQCYAPKKTWNMDLVEQHIWAEVEDVLEKYQDSAYNVLLDRLEAAKDSSQKQMVKAKDEIDRCKLERQRLLTSIRKGYVTGADIELQFRAVKEDEERWQEELANAEILNNDMEASWQSFWNQLQTVRQHFNYGFCITPEKKKEILNALLQEFILNKDGQIELRFKLPVNKKQVAEIVCTQSVHNVV
jgi:hypothetical protein